MTISPGQYGNPRPISRKFIMHSHILSVPVLTLGHLTLHTCVLYIKLLSADVGVKSEVVLVITSVWIGVVMAW